MYGMSLPTRISYTPCIGVLLTSSMLESEGSRWPRVLRKSASCARAAVSGRAKARAASSEAVFFMSRFGKKLKKS